jgi:hypothetical protein
MSLPSMTSAEIVLLAGTSKAMTPLRFSPAFTSPFYLLALYPWTNSLCGGHGSWWQRGAVGATSEKGKQSAGRADGGYRSPNGSIILLLLVLGQELMAFR